MALLYAKSKEGTLLFACGMNFCSATSCPHCWSSTCWSLHNWKLLFSWGSWKSLGTKCTIILVLELCLKRYGIASRSISFAFCPFYPQFAGLTGRLLYKMAQTFVHGKRQDPHKASSHKKFTPSFWLKKKKKTAYWKVLGEFILVDVVKNTHPSSRVTWFSEQAWEILFIIRTMDC